MTLRELMTERILFAVTEDQLHTDYDISIQEIYNLSDLDFLELYEEVVTIVG